jgi:hypothetical protein
VNSVELIFFIGLLVVDAVEEIVAAAAIAANTFGCSTKNI